MDLKSFTQTVHDGVKKLEKNAEKDASDAVTDPDNASSHEKQVGEDSAQSFSSEARKQSSRASAEITEIAEKAEEARKTLAGTAAKVPSWGKRVWGGLFWKFLLPMSILAGLHFAGQVYKSFQDQPVSDGEKIQRQARDLNSQVEYLSTIVRLQNDDFNIMYGGLAVAPAPTPDAPAPEAAPAPVEIPAAAAAAPAEVELTSESGTKQEVQTTVGNVYRNSPEPVKRQIETDAPKIEHDYNTSITTDPNSCFVRHCLGGAGHRDITVTNGDNSATIHVSY